jgi:uncharacterized protein (DUF1501 family)
VVLCPDVPTTVGPPLWNSAFLPAMHQGTFIPSKTEHPEQIVGKDFDPKKLVSFLRNDKFSLEEQRRELDLLVRLENARRAREGLRDPALEAAIESMEIAYRMQTEAQEAFDVNREPQKVRDAYGKGYFSDACLVARRLVERGVRMVQVFYGNGQPWDDHSDLEKGHRAKGKDTDKPIAALLKDLKAKGLLDETLIVWGGEFGRTPMNEGRNNSKFLGRDHHPRAFTVWMAGGGIKAGATVGKTDELGYNPVEEPVDVHDLHATILHLLGLEHTKLTYRFQGRDFRLTDVSGNVVKKLLA